MTTTVTVDALDVIELTEILEYFIECLDALAKHDLAKFLVSPCSNAYDIDDLRADLARLIHRLKTSPTSA
jgi:hypothetical protein